MKQYAAKVISVGVAVFVLLGGLLCALPFCGLSVVSCADRMPDRAEVEEIFERNRDTLLTAADDGTLGSLSLRGVESVFDNLHDESHPYVEFPCGGYGMGGGTGYTGFFYSPEDDPFAIWCAPRDASLYIPQDGGWYYREDGGDNTVLIVPLGDGFYYYLAEF